MYNDSLHLYFQVIEEKTSDDEKTNSESTGKIIPKVEDILGLLPNTETARQGDNSAWSQACAIREFDFGSKYK